MPKIIANKVFPMSQHTPPYAYDSMTEIAGGREGRTLEISDATRARRPQFPRKETSPEGNRHTPGHTTHVTDNIRGNRPVGIPGARVGIILNGRTRSQTSAEHTLCSERHYTLT